MNILEFAIKMEREGEAFYLEQAALFPEGELGPVARFLAGEERRHAEILQSRMKELPYNLEDVQVPDGIQGVFAREPEEMGNWGALSAQTAFYRLGAQKEDESIRLYEELREQRETEEDKTLFSYLVRQERQHLELLEQLSEMLRRSDEWVESAEFGIRPEY